jgi:hypothetical protein
LRAQSAESTKEVTKEVAKEVTKEVTKDVTKEVTKESTRTTYLAGQSHRRRHRLLFAELDVTHALAPGV